MGIRPEGLEHEMVEYVEDRNINDQVSQGGNKQMKSW